MSRKTLAAAAADTATLGLAVAVPWRAGPGRLRAGRQPGVPAWPFNHAAAHAGPRRRLGGPVLGVVLLVLLLLPLAALLYSFQGVVAQGVVQGTDRRSAEAARADDLLRCRLISQTQQRRQCLARMQAP